MEALQVVETAAVEVPTTEIGPASSVVHLSQTRMNSSYIKSRYMAGKEDDLIMSLQKKALQMLLEKPSRMDNLSKDLEEAQAITLVVLLSKRREEWRCFCKSAQQMADTKRANLTYLQVRKQVIFLVLASTGRRSTKRKL